MSGPIAPTASGVAGLFTIPLSWLYGAGVRARLFMYSAGILPQRAVAGVRVISVGNLTVGGAGKTPVTILIAGMAGKGAAIVSRGYGRRSVEPVQVVSDGKGKLAAYPLAADEAMVCALALPDVPVVCAPRRLDGIVRAKELGAATVALDDAFSHLAVARDRNLLLVDALDPFGGGRLLPAGKLREPASSAVRADVALITRSNMIAPEALVALERSVGELVRPGTPVFRCAIVADSVRPPSSGNPADAREYLGGRKVRLLSGIASPGQFEKTVDGLGAVVTGHSFFPDHHPFTEEEISRVIERRGADEILLTTQKDFVRLSARHGKEFAVLTVRAVVEDEAAFRRLLFG